MLSLYVTQLFRLVGELHECKIIIKGYGGQKNYNVHIGTIKWHYEDDQEKVHTYAIPKAWYIPGRGVRLSSPQYRDQTQKYIKPESGTHETPNHMPCTVYFHLPRELH